jgi:hypothetical protein
LRIQRSAKRRKKLQKGEIPEGLFPQTGIAGEGLEFFFGRN